MANPHYIRDDDDEHDDEDESTPPLRSVHSGDLGQPPDVWVRHASEHESDDETISLSMRQIRQQANDHLRRLTRPLGEQEHSQPIQPISGGIQRTTGVPAAAPPAAMDAGWQDTYRPFVERRAYDAHRTGRCWPGVQPQTDAERAIMQTLCVAPGNVSAPLLARVYARRYLRASYSPSVYNGDRLAHTDIYSIAYFGLDLDIDAFAFRERVNTRNVLAVYEQDAHHIALDDAIFTPPPRPVGWRASDADVIEPYVWRDAIDASWAARFLVGWCTAVHLTSIMALPLTVAFVPVTPPQGFEGRAHPDILNRYQLAMIACCELLAPRDRLVRQIAYVLREAQSYDGVWLNAEHVASCAGYNWRGNLRHYFPAERAPDRRDPVERMLDALASMNRCPQFLVERSLDSLDDTTAPDLLDPAWIGGRLIKQMYNWLANPQPHHINRYQQAQATYESNYGDMPRSWLRGGNRQQPSMRLTLAL